MPLLRAPDTSCESSQRAHAISTDVLAPDPEGRGAASAPLGLAHHPPRCSWSLFKAALVPLIKRSSASRCWSHREHPGVAMVAPVRAPKVPVCLSPSVLRTEASPAEAQRWPAERGTELAPATQSVQHQSFPLSPDAAAGEPERHGSLFSSVRSVRGLHVWERGVCSTDGDSSFSTVGARPGLDPAPHSVCG